MQDLRDLGMHFQTHSWNLSFSSTVHQFSSLHILTNYYREVNQQSMFCRLLCLAKKISNRIVKPQVLVHAKITDVNLNEEEIFIEHKKIYLGGTTKHTLNKLLNEGDISDAQYNKFFLAAH